MKSINFIEQPTVLSLKQMGVVFGGSSNCKELNGSCTGFSDTCDVFTGDCSGYTGTCLKFTSPTSLLQASR